MCFVIREIEGQISDAQLQCRFFRITPTERSHAREQFLHREWLRQIIIRAELQSSHPIVEFAARRQHQNPARNTIGAHSPQHFKTVDTRKTDIEHDEIESGLLRFTQSGFAVTNHHRIMPCLSKSRRYVPREARFIFNNKNPHESADGAICVVSTQAAPLLFPRAKNH